LDVSTKTGWALLVSSDSGADLEAYGQEPPISMPDGPYPEAFVDWAYACFSKIVDLIDRLHPDVLVIEETASGSKSIFSQKILEYIHFLLAKLIKESKIKTCYLMTEVWRREVGCVMTKEEKEKNKAVRDYKKKVLKETGKKTTIAYDKNGKRIGLTGRKHVNVRRANEEFGKFLRVPLRKKDEDTADSLMLAFCYHARRMKKV
jgi:Holliday junction resolvasome RuvABC endonuclease subunit